MKEEWKKAPKSRRIMWVLAVLCAAPLGFTITCAVVPEQSRRQTPVVHVPVTVNVVQSAPSAVIDAGEVVDATVTVALDVETPAEQQAREFLDDVVVVIPPPDGGAWYSTLVMLPGDERWSNGRGVKLRQRRGGRR